MRKIIAPKMTFGPQNCVLRRIREKIIRNLALFLSSVDIPLEISRPRKIIPLLLLLMSNHRCFQHTATYAAAVLHRLFQGKSEHYQRRFSSEVRQSLFDGGTLTELADQPAHRRSKESLASSSGRQVQQQRATSHQSPPHRERSTQISPVGRRGYY